MAVYLQYNRRETREDAVRLIEAGVTLNKHSVTKPLLVVRFTMSMIACAKPPNTCQGENNNPRLRAPSTLRVILSDKDIDTYRMEDTGYAAPVSFSAPGRAFPSPHGLVSPTPTRPALLP